MGRRERPRRGGVLSWFGLVCALVPVWVCAPACEEARERAGQVESAAREESEQIEALIARGEQVAPIASAMVRLYTETFQGSTRVEPIYQPIADGEEGTALTDEAIAQMPRTEVVDGVTVGFKDLVQTDTHGRTKERGVLVTWRRGDHLVGFVYHSEERIDLDALVRETPKLMALIEQAVAEGE